MADEIIETNEGGTPEWARTMQESLDSLKELLTPQEPQQEPQQEPEQELEKEPEQETEQEPAETDENPAENQPVEVKTDKSSSAKKPRKNAKKGA